MHTRRFLALGLLPLAGLACTALLGDFTVGTGGGDSGGDTLTDVNADVGNDGSTVSKMKCTETSNTRVQITKGNSVRSRQVRMALLPNANVRVIADSVDISDGGNFSNATIQSFTFNPQNVQQGFNPQPFVPAQGNQVYSILRYGVGPTAGFAVLYTAYDQNTQRSYVYAIRMPDDQSTWTTPAPLFEIPQNVNNFQVSGTVIDGTTDDYYVVVTTYSATEDISAGEVKPGGSAPPTINSFPVFGQNQGTQNIIEPGIAIRGAQAFIILSPNGNQGPPPVDTPVKLLIPGSTNPVVSIQPPSGLNYFPIAFGAAVDPLKVNLVMLTADLQSSTLSGAYDVGQLAVTDLAAPDPTKLTPTIPTSPDGGTADFKDVLINKPNAHWEVANAKEQFLAVAPTAQPNISLTGLNFGWWDAVSGQQRAYSAGDANLFNDIQFIPQADITFVTLIGSFAQLDAVFISATGNGNNYPPDPADLWFAQVGCVTQK